MDFHKRQLSVHTPSLSALTANHYVRYFLHTTLKPPPFINPYHPFHQPSSYIGFQDTPTFLAMTLLTEQHKEATTIESNIIHLHQFHALFSLSTSSSSVILILMSEQAKFAYIAGLLSTYNNYKAAGILY